MKRTLAIVLAMFLVLSIGSITVSAAELEGDASVMNFMPVDYTYTDSVRLASGTSFPPGWANFDVTISGVYDVNRDTVVSIDTASSVYRGGVNCHEHDVEVVAWKNASEPNIVYWRLEGTITFSWTSPVTGIQYETVFLRSSTYSFDAGDRF